MKQNALRILFAPAVWRLSGACMRRAALLLLVTMLTTATAWAYGIENTGSCGTSATYAITGSEGNYTLTISGTGKISDYAFCHKDLSGIKSVVINEGINSIGQFSFQKDGNYAVEFTSVSFPSTLTTIGWGAFQVCTSLTAVHIPASVTLIDGLAFYGCTGLSSVTIASGSQLQTIYSNAFDGCSFTEIVLPCAQLSSIGQQAFRVTSLTKIVCLTETSLSVDQYVFTGSTSTPKDVYMYASKKVNWPGANSVRALYTLSAGTNVTAISGTKTYGDYYGEGTTITVSTTCNRPGFTVGGMPVAATSTGVSGAYTLTLPSLSSDAATVSASEVSVLTNGTGTKGDPYRISTVSDWNTFAGMINACIDADKYYVLTTDIGTEQEPVTTMVGTINAPFRGTLNRSDDFNKTITVALSSSTDDCALFGCLDRALVENLIVRGAITTSAKYAASIAAHNKGTTRIWGCTSYVTIESTVSTTSDGTHGGFVAVNESNSALVIRYCAFKGKLLGANATSSGGFVGYNGGSDIVYENCLFAPTEITMSASGSATFNRNGRQTFDSEYPSYYTLPFGETQGTQVYASTDDIPASCTYTTVEACDYQTYYLVTGMTIGSAADWTTFAEAVNSGNSFAGLTVKLAEDFDNTSNPVTTMVGTSTNKFSGTFDGQGRTLNVELTSEGEYTAPFRYVNGGTFKNLRTAGTVTTSHKYATGLIGSQAGSTTVQNCQSSVTIISSVNGDGTHGGFIATGGGNFQGCVFDGVICTTTEYTDTPTGTNSCGGFVGWISSSVSISNSLYAPAAIPEGKYRIGSTGSATFARGNTPSLTNSYYTEALGTAQGKQARSITAGEYVTVGHAGEATEYTVSGIKAYKATDANGDGDPFIAGITYNNKVYAGEDDEVSLELSNTPPTGYVFNYYTVSPDEAWLNEDGDNYTLTMPDVDVTVGADFSMQTTTETKELAAGWNWFSTSCEITLDDLKAALLEALPGTNSITIRSKSQSTTYSNSRWRGQLNSLDVLQMYMIHVNNDCEITLEGYPIDPAEHPVTIAEGDNWIGFPFAQSMSVANAFAGFAVNGDIIISQTASACYSNGTWKGTLKNLEPGQGYIYKSAASGDRTFVYPIGGDADSGSNDSFNGVSYWEDFNYHDFMYNRPFVAAIKIDGQYVTADDYDLGDMEVVAFVGEECRGNRFTLTNRYVENGGEQYPVLDGMPVYYDYSGDVVTFKLYANGIEYTDCEILYDGDLLTINTGEDHVEGWMDPEIPIILSFTSPAVDLVLSDTGANAEAIEQNNNRRANVTLSGRTLWKDGAWNTLCLPFDVTIAGSVLEGADVRALETNPTGYDHATGLDGNTLYLNFTAEGAVTEIKAGTPYIIKWGTPDSHPDTNLTDPVFQGVTVSNTTPTEVTFTGGAFKGSYNYLKWAAGTEYPSILLLGTGSALFWPDGSDDSTLGAFRAYFELSGGVNAREFVLNFGEDHTTKFISTTNFTNNADWYTLDGRKLDAKPTQKGLYINNGRKVVIK